ncbi:MAG: hypothetical protein IID35_10145 [Planctomycetes bacterium]|nr:hypothetical protein [Planctomycetota bacterium]
MATEDAHLKKAKTNQAFLETIPDEFSDWLAIVAFYTAVHLVEAIFARQGVPSHNHPQRNRRLKRRYPEIWRNFRPLYNASTLLRYTDLQIDAKKIREELIETRLKTVEDLVHSELSEGK